MWLLFKLSYGCTTCHLFASDSSRSHSSFHLLNQYFKPKKSLKQIQKIRWYLFDILYFRHVTPAIIPLRFLNVNHITLRSHLGWLQPGATLAKWREWLTMLNGSTWNTCQRIHPLADAITTPLAAFQHRGALNSSCEEKVESKYKKDTI